MSVTEPEEPDPRGGSDAETPVPDEGRVNQPWRALIAALEVVVAVLLVVAAVWSWNHAIIAIELPQLPPSESAVTRMMGDWIALAVVAVTVAGLLVLDAIRQIVLAWRVRPRRKEAKPTSVVSGEA